MESGERDTNMQGPNDHDSSGSDKVGQISLRPLGHLHAVVLAILRLHSSTRQVNRTGRSTIVVCSVLIEQTSKIRLRDRR